LGILLYALRFIGRGLGEEWGRGFRRGEGGRERLRGLWIHESSNVLRTSETINSLQAGLGAYDIQGVTPALSFCLPFFPS